MIVSFIPIGIIMLWASWKMKSVKISSIGFISGIIAFLISNIIEKNLLIENEILFSVMVEEFSKVILILIFIKINKIEASKKILLFTSIIISGFIISENFYYAIELGIMNLNNIKIGIIRSVPFHLGFTIIAIWGYIKYNKGGLIGGLFLSFIWHYIFNRSLENMVAQNHIFAIIIPISIIMCYFILYLAWKMVEDKGKV